MHSSDEFFKRTKAGTKYGEQNYLFSRVAWISWSPLRHCGGGHTKNTLALRVGKVSSRIHTEIFALL
jgi:hypothetical protein